MGAAQATTVHMLLRPSSFAPQVKSRLHANTIEDKTSAAWPGDRLDPRGCFAGVAIVYDVGRAERLCLLQLCVVHVHHDNAHRRQHAQRVNRHVPESADADKRGQQCQPAN